MSITHKYLWQKDKTQENIKGNELKNYKLSTHWWGYIENMNQSLYNNRYSKKNNLKNHNQHN